MKRTLAFVLIAFAGCQSPRLPSPCNVDIDRVVDALDVVPATRGDLVEDLRDSQWAWSRDPAFAAVSSELSRPGVTTFIGVEIGRAPGGGYNSVWFVEGPNGHTEVATGPERGRIRRRVISDSEWANLKARWEQSAGHGVGSLITPVMMDGPVSFVCSRVQSHRASFIIHAMATRNVQFAILKDLLSSSRFGEVPVEIRRAVGEPSDPASGYR